MAAEGGDEGRLEAGEVASSWDPDREPGVIGVELIFELERNCQLLNVWSRRWTMGTAMNNG